MQGVREGAVGEDWALAECGVAGVRVSGWGLEEGGRE
jgi:hypothetical protein